MMAEPTSPEVLDEALLRRVLNRLEIDRAAPATLETLRALYASWSRRVPFDNVRKLIHVRAGNPARLPGCEPVDFFEAWLKHGTGGTCWSGANPLYVLLNTLGFRVQRGIATMLAAPHLPPNHATVKVIFDDGIYLVDSAMLSHEPLRLEKEQMTRVAHPAWGVDCRPLEDEKWMIRWRAMHEPEGFDCRIESFGHSAEDYHERHEHTRGWSPFNYQVYARLNRDDEVRGLAFGNAVTLLSDNGVIVDPVEHEQRMKILIEDLGMSEEIVSQLPEDVPTPPPPGSRTAASEAAEAATEQ